MKRSGIVLLAVTLNITIFKEDYIYCHSKDNSSSLICHKTLPNPSYKGGMIRKKA